jgi:ACR3 family arsenite transporter
LAPTPFRTLGALSLANVNLSVAVVIWLMIVPMLPRVEFGAIGAVARH